MTLTTTFETGTIIIPTLQMRKLRHRHFPRACKWQSQNLNSAVWFQILKYFSTAS